MVYSTNPNFKYDTEEAPQIETLAPERQDLRVWLCLLYTSDAADE